jgi:hypothetical protein
VLTCSPVANHPLSENFPRKVLVRAANAAHKYFVLAFFTHRMLNTTTCNDYLFLKHPFFKIKSLSSAPSIVVFLYLFVNLKKQDWEMGATSGPVSTM